MIGKPVNESAFIGSPITKETNDPDDGLLHVVQFDGSCAPNPGPMGCGVAIYQERVTLSGWAETCSMGAIRSPLPSRSLVMEWGGTYGEGTNNIAEYIALNEGLKAAHRLCARNVLIEGDSKLIIEQVQGNWKMKTKHFRFLIEEARDLLGLFHSYSFQHIPREENEAADALSRVSEPFHGLGRLPGAPTPLSPQRYYTDAQAALMRYWYISEKSRNSYLMSRIFGGTDGQVFNVMTGQTYKYLTEEHLP